MTPRPQFNIRLADDKKARWRAEGLRRGYKLAAFIESVMDEVCDRAEELPQQQENESVRLAASPEKEGEGMAGASDAAAAEGQSAPSISSEELTEEEFIASLGVEDAPGEISAVTAAGAVDTPPLACSRAHTHRRLVYCSTCKTTPRD